MKVAEIEIKYRNQTPASQRPQIKKSRDAYQILKELFPDIEHRERMVMLLMNRKSCVLGSYLVSIGGIDQTICDVRVIYQACLKANASSFILAHNHPSGNLEPSKLDFAITEKVKLVGEILGIKLLDHIIVTNEDYTSMANKGLM